MSFEQGIFYFFAAIMLLSALAVITVRNPVHAAMFLVLTFFSAAGLWLMLEAEFLAITLVLVYVGAVMVLFLFVVMMLDINLAPLREGFIRFLPVAGVVAVLVVVMMGMVVGPETFGLGQIAAPERAGSGYSNTAELGRVLYTVYVYPFELAAVILLVAIIAAISLALRRRPNSKKQDPDQQIAVRKGDRLRVLDDEERRKNTL
ncbi:MAG: NADH-quinone oxidoreductase subunit J [Pseudomonadota bacterium]